MNINIIRLTAVLSAAGHSALSKTTKGDIYHIVHNIRVVAEEKEVKRVNGTAEVCRQKCLTKCTQQPYCRAATLDTVGTCEIVLSDILGFQRGHESAYVVSNGRPGGFDMNFVYGGVFGGRPSAYMFDLVERNWGDARDYCQSLGADLVSIETPEEMEYLKQQIKEENRLVQEATRKGKDRFFGFWTSGSDEEIEGSWKWKATGKFLTFINWYPGFPDNLLNQDYLNIMMSSLQWDDTKAIHVHFSICEKM